MSEEIADSNEISESTDSGMDMEGALDTLSSELFPNSEPEEVVETEFEEDNEQIAAESDPESESVEEPVEARKAPQSWKKEMSEKFSTLDPEVQDYIELRETQMRDGLELNKEDSNLGRTMRDTLQPYSQMLDHIKQEKGVEAPQVIQHMLNAHYSLSTATPEGKIQLFNKLAQEYGINLAGEEAKEVDPLVQNMQNELQSIKQDISARRESEQNAQVTKVNNDITAFAEDPAHPYFDEVSDQIVAFINAGEDLEGAYEKAVWANPITRQKEMERLQQEKLSSQSEKEKQRVAKAKKASSTNVRGRNTRNTPTAPNGTMEDTMRETFKDIQSRSH